MAFQNGLKVTSIPSHFIGIIFRESVVIRGDSQALAWSAIGVTFPFIHRARPCIESTPTTGSSGAREERGDFPTANALPFKDSPELGTGHAAASEIDFK